MEGDLHDAFGLDLRTVLEGVKDMRIALGLAESAGTESGLSAAAVDLWARAAEALPGEQDHTEIARWTGRSGGDRSTR